MKITTIFILLLLAFKTHGQFYAIHIPNNKIDKIKIDGDTIDWNWMPEKYIITEKYMKDSFNKNLIDNNSWQCRIKIGWSDITNKIYINAKIIDDIVVLTKPDHYMNDCFQLAINANNKGGVFTGENSKNHVVVCWYKPDTIIDTRFNLGIGPKWMFNTPTDYFKWKVVSYKTVQKKNVIIYELSMNLFDKWEKESPGKSNLCLLVPNKKIKMTLIFEDADKLDNSRLEWTTKASWEWYMDANYFSEFVLAPPLPTKDISWHNIDYVLNP